MHPEMLKNLLASADPEESAKHSFDDYHARGLCYVNLLRSERFTAKLYLFDPTRLRPEHHGFVVNPHSHGYNFETYVVAGSMANVVFSPSEYDASEYGASRWHAHRYLSPIKGEKRVVSAGPTWLSISRIESLSVGQSYYLDTEEVHTISVAPMEATVLFLLQYHDVRARDTLLFTPTPQPPALDGLYTRMTPERIGAELDRVRALVGSPSNSGWVSQMLARGEAP